MFIFLCSDICDQSVECKSQLEEEASSSEDAELEEEESEDGGETGEEEELEDDGEMGEDDSDSEDDEESDNGPDLARGIGNIETSSEDDEDLNELFPKEPEIEHSWRELDKDAPRGDEVCGKQLSELFFTYFAWKKHTLRYVAIFHSACEKLLHDKLRNVMSSL